MNKSCPLCGQIYEVEPGFFMGASYVAYSFGVALFIANIVAWTVLGFSLRENPTAFMVGYLGMLFALVPLMFRYARSIYIHAFSGIRYDPEAIEEGEG